MKKNFIRIIALVLAFTMLIGTFAGCSGETEVNRPVAVTSKTDLKDVSFVFTYGELKEILPGDKLATLYENFNKKLDDREVELSYYELVSKYGSEDYFEDILALITEEEWAQFTGNQQEVLDYFNGLINDIKVNKTAFVSYDEAFWINHGDGVVFKSVDGVELPDQDKFRAAFRLYADMALENIDSFLMNSEEIVEKGADLTDIIYPIGEKNASTLTLADLYTDKETNTYPIYTSVVPTLVYDLDEKGNNAEDEEGEYIFVPSELYRTICMVVKPEEASVKKAFTVREKDGIMEQFKAAESYMKLNSFEIAFTPCKITAGINAVTDEMAYATYEKNMIITANITFAGALADYGTVVVEFPCTSSITYNFGWSVTE
ncbi:MAG: hypothetical protein IJZ16_08265 [Clostridia bacterium]|nr:hypothetical protein [Clostridia bacterium]